VQTDMSRPPLMEGALATSAKGIGMAALPILVGQTPARRDLAATYTEGAAAGETTTLPAALAACPLPFWSRSLYWTNAFYFILSPALLRRSVAQLSHAQRGTLLHRASAHGSSTFPLYAPAARGSLLHRYLFLACAMLAAAARGCAFSRTRACRFVAGTRVTEERRRRNHHCRTYCSSTRGRAAPLNRAPV